MTAPAGVQNAPTAQALPDAAVERIGEVPIYHTDGIVRRARSLQQTRDAMVDCAWMHSRLAQELALQPGDRVRVSQDGGEAVLAFACDDRLPHACVRVAMANESTMRLGAPFGPIKVEAG